MRLFDYMNKLNKLNKYSLSVLCEYIEYLKQKEIDISSIYTEENFFEEIMQFIIRSYVHDDVTYIEINNCIICFVINSNTYYLHENDIFEDVAELCKELGN